MSRKFRRQLVLMSLFFVLVSTCLAPSIAPASFRNAQLVNSNFTGVSSQNLIADVKTSGKIAYWLGPKLGDVYLFDNFISYSAMIIYQPKNSSALNRYQSFLTIETFKDHQSFNNRLHPLVDPSGRKFIMSGNKFVEYNTKAMNCEIVIFKIHPEIVVINYPSVQSASSLMSDADVLQPVI